jgi:hypothetical protein
MMGTPPGTKTKYVPHKVIRDGAVYLGLAGSDNVLMIRTVVNKVSALVDSAGQELKGPDGMPLYLIQSQPVITTLTKDEWNRKKEMVDLD